MSAFGAWLANPVTGALIVGFWFVLLCLGSLALVTVIRLGGIQLAAELSQHPNRLPGFPRRSDAFATLVLFLLIATGAILLLFTLAVVRGGHLAAADTGEIIAVALAGWAIAVGGPLTLVRGSRVEPLAGVVITSLRPLAPVLRRLASRQEDQDEDHGDDEDDEFDEHDLQAFIGAGEEAGIIAAEDGKLIESILELGETVAREIMTPRTDVAALPATAAFAEVQARFAESMFTRLPVFRDSLDRIEGVVHVKDVLRAVAAREAPSCRELMRPVLIVPETKPLKELLREFQSSRQQLGVVVDEYGGTSGIVTLEDVLEEIVGEIQDEHQREAPDVEDVGGGIFMLSGGAHVDVLEELFGVEVDEGGFDSVAGLVLERLGHLPRPGERVTWQGLLFETVEVDRRRLRRVRVRRAASEAATP